MFKLIPAPVFFGSLIIILGIIAIVNAVFSLKIPGFRIVFAIFIIWLGINLIIMPRPHHSRHAEDTPRNENDVRVAFQGKEVDFRGKELQSTRYSSSFGGMRVILKDVTLVEDVTKLSFDASFAGVDIEIDESLPIKVVGKTSFGRIEVLDRVGEGVSASVVHETASFATAEKKIEIHAVCDFGGIIIHR